MHRLAWMTDIHLNFLRPPEVDAFLDTLAGVDADAFLVSGDIGEAPDVAGHLAALDDRLRKPVHFVLGNHDYYRGDIAGVRAEMVRLCADRPTLRYLSQTGVVPLTEETCLVGHDGWGDGRLGDYFGSTVRLMDWKLIADLHGLDPAERLARLNALGDEAAAHLRQLLPDALARFRRVLLLTHVPPFREACLYEGKVSDDNWLPGFTCKAVGDVLADAMRTAPTCEMTVLCGHTHGSGDVRVLPNLRVLIGGAKYGSPTVQRVLAVE